MKRVSLTMSLVAFILMPSLVLAQNEKGWVGYKFRPEECVEIKAGEFEVKRKLCNVRYRINRKNTKYEIKGSLDFNEKFVPRIPRRVELELLFIDEKYVCRKQINMEKTVDEIPLSFSIEAVKNTHHMYIRTYYTLYYQ